MSPKRSHRRDETERRRGERGVDLPEAGDERIGGPCVLRGISKRHDNGSLYGCNDGSDHAVERRLVPVERIYRCVYGL